MQFNAQVIVTGVKRSKGEMEGRPYDSTKVYVQTVLDASKGDAFGFAGNEYNWGTSTNFEKLAGQKFPFEGTASFEVVTNGKTQKTILLDLKPNVQAVKTA